MPISLARPEHRIRESLMVYCIGPFLCLKGKRTAVADHFAVLAGIAAVKEVSAIELYAALVCQDFHTPAG